MPSEGALTRCAMCEPSWGVLSCQQQAYSVCAGAMELLRPLGSTYTWWAVGMGARG